MIAIIVGCTRSHRREARHLPPLRGAGHCGDGPDDEVALDLGQQHLDVMGCRGGGAYVCACVCVCMGVSRCRCGCVGVGV